MPSADWKVELVDDQGEADYSVTVVGQQVIDMTGAAPGDVLTVQPDGLTVEPDPPGTPGAHAATHEDGGTDEVTLAQSQITGLVTDLGLKAPLASPTFTGTVTFGDGVNLDVGTTTGTKLGTATTQKLGFFNATPVAQIAGNTDVLAGLVTLGLRAASSNPPLNIGTGAVTAGVSTFQSAAIGDFAGASGIMRSGLVAATEYAVIQDSNGGTYVNAKTGQTLRLRINNVDLVNVTGTGISFQQDVTVTDGKNIITGTTTGLKVGTATAQKLGFHNATPVIQRAGAAQAAVGTTAATQTNPWGFSTQAQADAIVTLVNEIRAALVEKGLIKGAA